MSVHVVIYHTKESFKSALVGMVVSNALSFRVFGTNSFKALVGEAASKLKVSLDKDQIRSYVCDEAALFREKIKTEMKDTYIFLKFDCATRIRVNYIGINAQYVQKARAL